VPEADSGPLFEKAKVSAAFRIGARSQIVARHHKMRTASIKRLATICLLVKVFGLCWSS